MVWRKFNDKCRSTFKKQIPRDVGICGSRSANLEPTKFSKIKKRFRRRRLQRKVKLFYRGVRYDVNTSRTRGARLELFLQYSKDSKFNPTQTPPLTRAIGNTSLISFNRYAKPNIHVANVQRRRPVAFRSVLNCSNTAPFRSYWFNRFMGIFIARGKKAQAMSCLFKVFGILKNLHGRTPSILLFEILETYRVPFSVILARRNKGFNRVHLLTWWKQYGQVLKWFRQAFKRKAVRSTLTRDKHLLAEFELILSSSPNGSVQKRRALLVQLAAAGRVYSHFRWKRRLRNSGLLNL